MKRIDLIAGARPNFMKIAPIIDAPRAAETRGGSLQFRLIHTGQHYDRPLGYLEFNYLVKHARGVITDSGGITEETTVLGVPCLTLRDNTERPRPSRLGRTNSLAPIRASSLPRSHD